MIDAQVGQAELYIRLVNSRDVTSQDALNAQPIQHYMYKYPVLVSGHSRCKGQAKLVKKYAKNSPARKLLVVCLTCCQAHLKEKKQFIRLFLEGRVIAEEGVAIELFTIRHGLYGIRTFWWHHSHISHNAPYLSPKILHNLCFHFSWVLQPSTEKLKTMLMQSFGGGRGEGANKVDYGRCASGVWLNSMASRDFFFLLTF